jgi:hypothetical protein
VPNKGELAAHAALAAGRATAPDLSYRNGNPVSTRFLGPVANRACPCFASTLRQLADLPEGILLRNLLGPGLETFSPRETSTLA